MGRDKKVKTVEPIKPVGKTQAFAVESESLSGPVVTAYDTMNWNKSNKAHFKRLIAEFYVVKPEDVFDIFDKEDYDLWLARKEEKEKNNQPTI
jgi:hypothetical protein